jgi:hypothetical protein
VSDAVGEFGARSFAPSVIRRGEVLPGVYAGEVNRGGSALVLFTGHARAEFHERGCWITGTDAESRLLPAVSGAMPGDNDHLVNARLTASQ